MSWAARRETSVPEDIAYCLLGLFNVHMPLLYGEGRESAFRRLQKEILAESDDESIFAWMRPQDDLTDGSIIALSPEYFRYSGRIKRAMRHSCFDRARPPYAMTNKGLRFEAILFDPKTQYQLSFVVWRIQE